MLKEPVIKELIIGGRKFSSRLFMGTGKFSSNEAMRGALEASGAQMVTVALKRLDFSNNSNSNILNYIDTERYTLLPNTAGAKNSEQAVRLARLARVAGCEPFVKLEVTPEPRYLLPDPVETLKAAEILVKDGFVVLPYINADPVLAKRLQEVGVAAVMPLGAPIGTNQGVMTKDQLAIIIEQAQVPVVVDAGLGAPSHAAQAIELGADAVLINTAIATAGKPDVMARAFKLAVEAAVLAREAGLAETSQFARATSPTEYQLTAFLK
ncbi:thiazole synthase [Deferribacterales bacterium RsTz2092]|nr:thiazole synthase [Deferribacterales bacterium]